MQPARGAMTIDRLRERAVGDAVARLNEAGHVVKRAVYIPGIYYVDNDPQQLTAAQLVNFAARVPTPEKETHDENDGLVFRLLLILAMLIGLLGTPLIMLLYKG